MKSFTLGDMLEFADITGEDISILADLEAAPARARALALIALHYIITKRDNPAWTVEDSKQAGSDEVEATLQAMMDTPPKDDRPHSRPNLSSSSGSRSTKSTRSRSKK